MMRMEMRATTTTGGTMGDVSPGAVPTAADARNERRYRYLLEHEFNSSCESIAC
jgi:hypothetical protein